MFFLINLIKFTDKTNCAFRPNPNNELKEYEVERYGELNPPLFNDLLDTDINTHTLIDTDNIRGFNDLQLKQERKRRNLKKFNEKLEKASSWMSERIENLIKEDSDKVWVKRYSYEGVKNKDCPAVSMASGSGYPQYDSPTNSPTNTRADCHSMSEQNKTNNETYAFKIMGVVSDDFEEVAFDWNVTKYRPEVGTFVRKSDENSNSNFNYQQEEIEEEVEFIVVD